MRSISIRINARGTIYLRDLIHILVVRNLKAQYKDSALGMAWAVINPLLYLLIFYFLFQLVFSLDIKRYSSFAFTGLLVWTWFQSSLNDAVSAIQNGQDLVRQPRFPVAVLPVISVTNSLITFLISLPLLLVLLILEDAALGLTLFFLPLLIAIQFTFTLGLAYFVAAINVPFRDTRYILAVLLQLYFFVTPIFYDLKNVPEAYQWIYTFNPLAHLVISYRDVLMHHTTPQWLPLAVIGLIALLLSVLGYRFFVRASYHFVEAL